MVDDYKYFKVGAALYPLSADTSTSLLQRSDPAIYAIINFIAAVLKINAGSAWDAAVNDLGLSQFDGYIVNSTIAKDPVPQLQQAQYKFPLLAVYRGRGTFEEFTVNHHRKKVIVKIDYILPPLSPGQSAKLFPILNSVENIILSRMMLGFDPGYLNGIDLFGTSGAYIDYIRMQSSEMDRVLVYPGSQDSPVFNFLHLEMEIRERDLVPDLGFELLADVDGYINSAINPDGYTDFQIADFILP